MFVLILSEEKTTLDNKLASLAAREEELTKTLAGIDSQESKLRDKHQQATAALEKQVSIRPICRRNAIRVPVTRTCIVNYRRFSLRGSAF